MQKEQVSTSRSRGNVVVVASRGFCLCVGAVLLGLAYGTLYAQEIDPYTVEVEVAARTQAALDGVLPQALDAVLVKLSGQRQASAMGAFNAELKSWVERYGYRSSKFAIDGGELRKVLHAVISFQPGPVNHARASLGLPSWVGERPRLALWVAVDYSGEREFLPEGAEYARFVLQDNASRRGVHLELPEMVVDGEVIEEAPKLADIWGGFTEQLSPFAQSLGADTTVLAAASHKLNGWQVRWNFKSKHGAGSFTSIGTSLDEALGEGLNLAIDQIAAPEVVAVSDQGQWRESIDILHLPDATAYHQLMGILSQQRLVNSVQLESASSQKLRLILVLNTSPEIVWGELDSETRLAYIGAGVGGVAAVFEYQTE